ncbi:MAG: hypothetical protein P4N41_03230 [Negativicutes bacterium]|nr:hypothetical protein [Negativicutes bacterium]
MTYQPEAAMSETAVRRTQADWDNYLREKLVELRKLMDESGQYLNSNMCQETEG